MAKVLGNILHACRVRDTMVVGIVIDSRRIATIARATSLAVDHDLRV